MKYNIIAVDDEVEVRVDFEAKEGQCLPPIQSALLLAVCVANRGRS